MNYCNLSEYARLRGVSSQAVKYAIETGRLKNSVRQKANGKWEVLPDIANVEWDANTDSTKQHNIKNKPARPAPFIRPGFRPAEAAPQENGISFVEAKAAREYYLAELARLEYEEKSEKLVDAEKVKSAWFKIITETKTKLLALPTKARANMPHLTLGDVSVLERLVREALEELSHGQP